MLVSCRTVNSGQAALGQSAQSSNYDITPLFRKSLSSGFHAPSRTYPLLIPNPGSISQVVLEALAWLDSVCRIPGFYIEYI
jgi:hypothetical protein